MSDSHEDTKARRGERGVPDGWKLEDLQTITKEKVSYGIVQAGPHVEGGVPYIKSSDVGGEIVAESLQKTSREIHHKYRRSSVHPADIVFSLRGNIGQCSIVPDSLKEANLTQGTARISVNTANHNQFVFYQVQSVPVLRRVISLSKGGTFQEISLEELRKLKILLPPLPEQRKIARVLSTWDRAIATTEKLLANSQQQKKALMQQLLTGKKRFPGFTDEWKEVRLGEVCEVNPTRSSRPEQGPVSFVEMSSVSEDGKIVSCVDRKYDDVSKGYTSFRSGDVLVAKITPCFENGKGALAGALTNGIGFGSTEFHVLRIYAEHSPVFVYFHTRLRRFRYQGAANMQGSAGQKRVPTDFLETWKIRIPSLLEQQKIASVLTTADKEIESLQQKLSQLKQEKAALMQQLLTGKRRVKVVE